MINFSQARIFNETPINPRRCLHILTKIIYLLNQVKRHFTSVVCEYSGNLPSSFNTTSPLYLGGAFWDHRGH